MTRLQKMSIALMTATVIFTSGSCLVADDFTKAYGGGALAKTSAGVLLQSSNREPQFAEAKMPVDRKKAVAFDITPTAVYGCIWGSYMNPKRPDQNITITLSDAPMGSNNMSNSLIWELSPVDKQPNITMVVIYQQVNGGARSVVDPTVGKRYPRYAVPFKAGSAMNCIVNLNAKNGQELLLNGKTPVDSNRQAVEVDLSKVKAFFKNKMVYLSIGVSAVPDNTIDGSIKIENMKQGDAKKLAYINSNKEITVEPKRIIATESGFDGAVRITAQDKDGDIICVTADVPYIDINGKKKMGQAHLFVKESLLGSDRKIPLVSIAHYEADGGSAKAPCEAGWAVVTPHYGAGEGEYPLEFCAGDSFNLARAINQWARRVPFIDRNHMHIFGGSAGGYMTLAMSAEMFPVSSAFAGQPLFNFAYNLNYLDSNSKFTEMMTKDGKDKLLPVISVVVPLKDQACDLYGKNLADDKWYYISPLSYLDRITCPIVVTCATGDTLCPHQQLTSKYITSLDGMGFPEGFSMDFGSLTKVDLARKRLDEVIPADQLRMIALPKPDDAVEMGYKQVIGGEPAPPEVAKMKMVDIPWNKDKQWTLLLHNEGAPTTYAGHFRYYWNETSPWNFAGTYQTDVPSPAILNEAKLTRLIDRYMGVSDRHVTLADGKPIHRLNFETIEKLDVVTGLLDYAEMGADHLERLQGLYKAASTKPFGATVGVKQLMKLRDNLLNKMK